MAEHPRVLVSREAATEIFSEIQRWVERGFDDLGVPLESLVYPLSALVPRRALVSPVELTRSEDIREIVVDGVAIAPDEVKAFSPANCHFAAVDLERVNLEFNTQIEALLERRPRLGVNSKLHSHPFSGGAFLSGGDLHHGVTSRQAIQWRERRGLATAILHVVYPDGTPLPTATPWELCAEGAVSKGRLGKVIWRIRSWVSDSRGRMLDLGDASVVNGQHDSVRAARRAPYWRTPQGERWCDAQKRDLREVGYSVSRNLLGRGWRRYLLQAGKRQLLIALPPDLPRTQPRVLEVRNALVNQFEVLSLPRWIKRRGELRALSLTRLARHYGAPA